MQICQLIFTNRPKLYHFFVPCQDPFVACHFASTKKGGNTWWWDSLHDLQRPRSSTCSVTAWLTFILNLNIHSGFPGMLVLRRSGKKSPTIPRHWHREDSINLVQKLRRFDFKVWKQTGTSYTCLHIRHRQCWQSNILPKYLHYTVLFS